MYKVRQSSNLGTTALYHRNRCKVVQKFELMVHLCVVKSEQLEIFDGTNLKPLHSSFVKPKISRAGNCVEHQRFELCDMTHLKYAHTGTRYQSTIRLHTN